MGTAPALAGPELDYINLDYPLAEANFTGIRGANIVGNYIIPDGNGASGGILYRTDTQSWVSIPTATANGVNYPGAYTALPYGPTFGSPDGVFRIVGSYKATASSGNVGYIFDAAAAPGEQYTDIIYPSSPGVTVLNTIPHSQFGNNVVGNYDTAEGQGSAFIYNAVSKTFTPLSGPGAVVTTAYGIYGDKVAGGYTDSLGLNAQQGFLYDMSTDTFTSYNHPDSIETHFQGITGAGRNGEYNLAADWTDLQGGEHAAILHIRADGTTEWVELDVPGSTLTSIDSIYAGTAVGFYFGSEGMMNYMVTVPWVYNPIRNTGTTTVSAAGATGFAGISGDDIVNDGTILVTGENAVGIHADTYGVVTNNGVINATGAGAIGVELDGLDSTLLNSGTITAATGAYAVPTGPAASGTMVVNTGVIDGAVMFAAGPQGRFENSGWLGVSGTGAPVTSLVEGVFVQTASGTLALRMTDSGYDALDVTGAARLSGTLAVSFQTMDLLKSYELVEASDEITGTFSAVSVEGLPALFARSLDYSTNAVTMKVAADLAALPNITSNQRAVGAAIDGIINNTGNNTLAELPLGLSPLYALGQGQLPLALGALSGEGYASEQSVIAGDSLYSRQALLGRLRQGSHAGESGAAAALAAGGPTLAPANAPGGPGAASGNDVTLWGQIYGSQAELAGDGNASDVSESLGGIISGVDLRVGDWLVGAALGYSQSNADLANWGSSFQLDSLLLGLYAGTEAGPFNVRLGGSYAFNQIQSDRLIAYPGSLQQATAQYDGGTAQLFGEVGYDFAVQTVAIEPFAGLAFVNVSSDSFTESGAAAGLMGSSESVGVGYSSLGIRAATNLALSGGMVLRPRASVAWQYAFGDTTPDAQLAFLSAPSAAFTVSGVPIAQNTALVELGADLLVSPQARLGLSYFGQFADGASDNAVQAELSWQF